MVRELDSIGWEYWIDARENGPEWGIKAGIPYLLPKAAPALNKRSA